MNKLFLCVLLSFYFGSCEQGGRIKNFLGDNEPSTKEMTDNALKFINGYVENCNKDTGIQLDMIEWVNSNNLSTKNFKLELERILDSAEKEDPELGLDADPILAAQDMPNEGFELYLYDKKTQYVTVRGRKWVDFKLNMKMKIESGKWLVDGCGMVNIPEKKWAKL